MKKLSLVMLVAAIMLLSVSAFAAPIASSSYGTPTFDFSTTPVSGLGFTGTIGLGQGFGVSVTNDPDTQLNINYAFGNLGDTPLKLMLFAGIQSGNGFGFWSYNNGHNTTNGDFGGQFGLELGIPLSASWQAYVMANIGTPAFKFDGGFAYYFNNSVDLHFDINYVSGWGNTNNYWNNTESVWYPSAGIGFKL